MAAKKTTTSPVQDLGRLLSTKEAAARLGTSEDALHQMRHRNEGPLSFHVSANKLVWPESDLDRYIADQLAATGKGGHR